MLHYHQCPDGTGRSILDHQSSIRQPNYRLNVRAQLTKGEACFSISSFLENCARNASMPVAEFEAHRQARYMQCRHCALAENMDKKEQESGGDAATQAQLRIEIGASKDCGAEQGLREQHFVLESRSIGVLGIASRFGFGGDALPNEDWHFRSTIRSLPEVAAVLP